MLLAHELGIDPFSLMGSYAGAIGLPQFMPSNIRQYAIDFDGTGNIDLRNSPVDAIGSIANFLKIHGWQRDLPLAFPTTLNDNTPLNDLLNRGLQATFELNELQTAGIIPVSAIPANMRFGLVDLQNGNAPTEYWLATNNFFALAHYNRSYFYAMSVVELSRALRAAHYR